MRNSLGVMLLTLSAAITCWAQKQTIERAEYFIGADPGEGLGIVLAIPTGNATVEANEWRVGGLPAITYGGVVYVRVKSSGFIDRNGNAIAGAWSLPTAVRFPTRSVLRAAEAKIVRPKLEYPLKKAAFAVDGTFNSVIEQIGTVIPIDSLEAGDTLYIRLQGHCELWGDWVQIPLRREHFMLPAPEHLNAAYALPTGGGQRVVLTWEYTSDGATGFAVERRTALSGWNVIGHASRDALSFDDTAALDGTQTYYWRVQALGASPKMASEYSNEATTVSSDVDPGRDANQESNFTCSPNPCTTTTTLAFSVPNRMSACVSIHDSRGEQIKQVFAGDLEPGFHKMILDAREYPSGMYFCRIRSGVKVRWLGVVVKH